MPSLSDAAPSGPSSCAPTPTEPEHPTRPAPPAPWGAAPSAPAGTVPARIVGDLRDRITSGALAPGDALPSTRVLARQLHVSRGSVVAAYEQLVGEGFLVATRGGTRVDPSLPVPDGAAPAPRPARPRSAGLGDLRPGAPDSSSLTSALWRSCWRAAAADPVAHPGAGSWRLRTLLAEHVRRTRQVAVDPEQVIITSGARDGLRLVLEALGDPGTLAVEDPGYPSLRALPTALGWQVRPVGVDRAGMSAVDAGTGPGAGARVMLVTPNHQFPWGSQMPASRRYELLDLARRTGALVVEDDFDAELRHTPPPLLALDTEERVVMLGSLSKTLSPALGLGYLVVPPRLVPGVEALSVPVSGIVQEAMTRFLEADGLRRHTARMRREYRRRAAIFSEVFPEGIAMEGGLHAIVPLPDGADEAAAVARCHAAGLAVEGLSAYWSAHGPRGGRGVVLGLGARSAGRLRELLARLASVLASSS